ncbi:MAG: hypothetical protein CL676_01815 [Bdellovibrionaceae bacterium]|nr:hypothetical protein [Pseudobdellovibrionaceae bacterium]|tara:strand:- start:7190 stop:7750 length:561 start_codon:yes stop_codon:yes gene_type:complete
MILIRTLLFGIALLLLSSCQTTPEKNYSNLIQQSSRSQKSYSGLHETFEATVVPLNRKVTQGMLEKRAELLGWTPERLQREQQKANEERLTHAKFFLRFFAPNSDYDDLHKPNSIWKIYLLLGNQKIEGEVSRDFSKLIELQAIYPGFDRFSTGYEVKFPIGQASLEDTSYSVQLTSSLGEAKFNF